MGVLVGCKPVLRDRLAFNPLCRPSLPETWLCPRPLTATDQRPRHSCSWLTQCTVTRRGRQWKSVCKRCVFDYLRGNGGTNRNVCVGITCMTVKTTLGELDYSFFFFRIMFYTLNTPTICATLLFFALQYIATHVDFIFYIRGVCTQCT